MINAQDYLKLKFGAGAELFKANAMTQTDTFFSYDDLVQYMEEYKTMTMAEINDFIDREISVMKEISNDNENFKFASIIMHSFKNKLFNALTEE